MIYITIFLYKLRKKYKKYKTITRYFINFKVTDTLLSSIFYARIYFFISLSLSMSIFFSSSSQYPDKPNLNLIRCD